MGQITDVLARLRDVGHPPQLDGYRQYKREQQAQGEPAVEYNEWIKTASAIGPDGKATPTK